MRLVFRIGPRSSSGSAFPIETGSDFGSPALSMKTGLLRSGTTKKPLENEDCGTGRRPWIIESAGEPLFGVVLHRSLAAFLQRYLASVHG
jgi:hypothetical protein